MADSTRNILVIGLMVCVRLLFSPASAAAATALSAEKALQPQALDYAGIYRLRQIDPGLTGEGVKFAVICRSITYIDGEPQNDYRPSAAHNCFTEAVFDFHDQNEQPAGISPHSTAICSILFGEDSNASDPRLGQFTYQGAAPRAKAEVYEFWHFLVNNVFAQAPPDADIITAGMGNPFEDWWTRGMEALAERYGLIVVAGIGNGSGAYDPVLYPAAASNVIGVGVVDSVNAEDMLTKLSHFALAYPQHSSFGPTADGRVKPDIVAPGNCLAADVAEPGSYRPTGNWSSYSTAVVAGTMGLLIQEAKQNPNLEPALSSDGRNCLFKAILLNSATKLPFWHKGRLETDDDHIAPLDYIQGAGLLNAVGAYSQLIAGQSRPGDCPQIGWDLNRVQTALQRKHVYEIRLEKPQNKIITATLAWNRHYGSTYPFEPVAEGDANLRLELVAVDPCDGDNSFLLDYSDSTIDNIEHIYAQADPNYTNYQIIVSYGDVADNNQPDMNEPYGLAWNVTEKQDSDSILWYDLNADGIVDESDFAAVLSSYLEVLKTPGHYFLGDINSNGTFDPNDLEVLLDHKGRTADWLGV